MNREERRFHRMLDEAGSPEQAAANLVNRLEELERRVAELIREAESGQTDSPGQDTAPGDDAG